MVEVICRDKHASLLRTVVITVVKDDVLNVVVELELEEGGTELKRNFSNQ
jgi:hypothetical protein